MKMLRPLPKSWSELSWQQLCDCWEVKIRYGRTPDVARAAALLKLCGLDVCRGKDNQVVTMTGETTYTLAGKDGSVWTVTPRELAYYAKKTLYWFDFPYGDRGEPEKKDEKGKLVQEARVGIPGCVSQFRDAMILPEEKVKVKSEKLKVESYFQLPQVACNNLTWQQYRALQVLVPQLFGEDTDKSQVLDLQAKFLAHCLIPELEGQADTTDKFRNKHRFLYSEERAEASVPFWKERLASSREGSLEATLFHICFQCYQTAVQYYSVTYPLLFSGDGKKDTMRDAIQGEIGTINSIMKYAGYSEQQQVYDSNLPFILDILNTMAKEAKEIEKINAKIKKKNK